MMTEVENVRALTGEKLLDHVFRSQEVPLSNGEY